MLAFLLLGGGIIVSFEALAQVAPPPLLAPSNCGAPAIGNSLVGIGEFGPVFKTTATSTPCATPIASARATQDVINLGVQSQLHNTMDQIKNGVAANVNGRTWRPLGYAADDSDDFPALGYADPNGTRGRNPLYTKAPQAQPAAAPTLQVSLWTSETGAGVRQTGFFNNGLVATNLASNTSSYVGLAGIDFLRSQFIFNGDYLLIGVLGGDAYTHSSAAVGTNTNVKAPTIGAYAAYILGGFSTDFAFTSSFMGLDTANSLGPAAIGNMYLTSYSYASNLNYRFNFTNNWWLEPTVGFTYFDQVWGDAEHALGFTDGQVTRVQGGLRAGTWFMWGATRIEPTLTGLAYSDTSVRGGTAFAAGVPGIPTFTGAPLPTDQGEVWGKGIAKVNFVFSSNFSAYLEGEVYRTSGAVDLRGYAGTVGLRLTF
jgi:autotransporter-like protein